MPPVLTSSKTTECPIECGFIPAINLTRDNKVNIFTIIMRRVSVCFEGIEPKRYECR